MGDGGRGIPGNPVESPKIPVRGEVRPAPPGAEPRGGWGALVCRETWGARDGGSEAWGRWQGREGAGGECCESDDIYAGQFGGDAGDG